MSPRRQRLRVVPTLALLLLGARAAAQDKPVQRQASFVWDDKQILRMTVGYRDIVDGLTAKNLAGGLPTTIVMLAEVRPEGGGEPLEKTFKSCRVIYDLWNEVYTITIAQPDVQDTNVVSPSLEGVLRRCGEVDRLAILHRSAVKGQKNVYVAAVVEVNPVSPEMLDRIRRWVSRPAGTATQAPGDALFGSFVGLFVAKIGSAERQLAFRTQTVSL